jgi:pantoate--beta-alanine ligase
MSSRNAYLSPAERKASTVLYRALDGARQAIYAGEQDGFRLADLMRRILAGESLASVDYAEIVDADSFESVTRLRGNCFALLAARIGSTRLIDNMLMEAVPASYASPGHLYRCSL